MLTSTQAAREAGVAASTIKRWADQGHLPFRRTVGGHRRFERAALDHFLRQRQGQTNGGGLASTWLEVLARGDRYEAEAMLLQARGRLGAWHRVADELGGVLVVLGDRWSTGQLSLTEEHVASETLRRSLRRVGDALPTPPSAPGCVLACAENDEHTLGLALVELALLEVGWTPIWLGRATPAAALPPVLARPEVHALALSASAASSDTAGLAARVEQVGSVCREAGVELLLGGAGAWPDPPSFGTRLGSCSELHARLRARQEAW